MASTRTGEGLSSPLSEVTETEALPEFQSEANELILLTKKEFEGSMSSAGGDQALSGQTRSLEVESSENEKREYAGNGFNSGHDLEYVPSSENSKCGQVSIDNRRDTATDNTATQLPSPGYETADVRTSATDEFDRYVSNLPPETLYRMYQARMRKQKEDKDRGSERITAMVDNVTKVESDMAQLEKNLNDDRLARGVRREDLDTEKYETQHEHQESPMPSGPDPFKSSQQHGLNSTMHTERLQKQRNLQLKVADAISQVGAAINEFFEVPDTRAPPGVMGGGSNHALQDYQMQLMLLEQQNKKRLMMARHEQDGVGETNSDDKPGKSTIPATSAPHELPDTTVETRFYHCEGAFGPGGRFSLDGMVLDYPGLYLSKTDPIHLLRVLYDWKDKAGVNKTNITAGEAPDAAGIDIIALMISSQPVADFFEKRLGLDNGSTRIIRVGKPFRSIIRNMPQLRDQLSKLEARYGSAETDDNVSGEPRADDITPRDDVEKGNLSTHPKPQSADRPYFSGKGTEPLNSSDAHEPREVRGDQAEGSNDEDMPDQAESFESALALQHFRHLIRFIDDNFGDKIALFEMLQAGKGREIAYEDLWMLFDIGDTIYCPFQPGGVQITNPADEDQIHTTRRRNVSQAYRVVATVGGGPLRTALEPKDAATDKDKDFNAVLIQLFTNRLIL